MTTFLTSYPYRATRRWARMSECEPSHASHDYTLSVNVREHEESYILNALVPGLKAEDLKIQVLEDVVTIEGEFKTEDSEYLMRELPHGTFRRSLRLPVAVDAEKAQARISDGVLNLTLPKAESARPKAVKISIK